MKIKFKTGFWGRAELVLNPFHFDIKKFLATQGNFVPPTFQVALAGSTQEGNVEVEVNPKIMFGLRDENFETSTGFIIQCPAFHCALVKGYSS